MTTDITDELSSSDPVYPRKGRILAQTQPPIIPYVPIAVVNSAGRTTYNKVATPPSVRQQTVAGKGALLPLVYGTDQVGAMVTELVALGTDRYLRLEWCEGPVDAISSVLVDGAAPGAGVTFTHYTGSQVTPDPDLVTAFAAQGITYTDTLTGVAYSVGKFPVGSTTGFPQCIAQVRGVKVKTSAAGTPAYNDNPVWLIAYLLTVRLGASIDWTSFATAAADACDVMVGSPAEKKRIIGATLDTEQSVNQWLTVALGYAGCYLWFDNGVYGLTADVATTPVSATITESLMRGGELQLQSRNTKQSPTVVRVYYTNTTATPWREDYAEAARAGAGTTEPYVVSEIRKPWINRHSQANRDAIETLNDFWLNNLSASFTTRDEGLAILPGDLLQITHSLGLSAKKMRVTASNPTEPGRYRVELREFDPAKYSSVVATGPTYNDTSLPTPTNPPTVGSVTLTEEIVTVPTGALPLSRIRGSWVALSNYPFLQGYRVVVTDPGGTTIDSQDVSTNVYISPPLDVFTTYTVNVYARSSLAVSATASTASITLISSGLGALASVMSAAIPNTGWTLTGFGAFPAPVMFTLWPGDPAARIRFDLSAVESTVYPGANMTTPGLATQLLDGADATVTGTFGSALAKSPAIDLGTGRQNAVFALLNVAKWTETYSQNMQYLLKVSYSSSMTIVPGTSVDGPLIWSGRWAQITVSTRNVTPFTVRTKPNFQIEFDQATIAALMPTITDTVSATSSASGAVTVQLPRKYITVTGVQITSQSSTQANPSYSNLVLSESTLASNTLDLHCYDAANARVAVPCSIQITGVEAP